MDDINRVQMTTAEMIVQMSEKFNKMNLGEVYLLPGISLSERKKICKHFIDNKVFDSKGFTLLPNDDWNKITKVRTLQAEKESMFKKNSIKIKDAI